MAPKITQNSRSLEHVSCCKIVFVVFSCQTYCVFSFYHFACVYVMNNMKKIFVLYVIPGVKKECVYLLLNSKCDLAVWTEKDCYIRWIMILFLWLFLARFKKQMINKYTNRFCLPFDYNMNNVRSTLLTPWTTLTKSSLPFLSISSSVKQCSGNEVIGYLKLGRQKKIPSGIQWDEPFLNFFNGSAPHCCDSTCLISAALLLHLFSTFTIISKLKSSCQYWLSLHFQEEGYRAICQRWQICC
jgi:hypothetical protein